MAELKNFYYNPTTWIDNRTTINAERLNNIEAALTRLVSVIESQNNYITELENRLETLINTNVNWHQSTASSLETLCTNSLDDIRSDMMTTLANIEGNTENRVSDMLTRWETDREESFADRVAALENDRDVAKEYQLANDEWKVTQLAQNNQLMEWFEALDARSSDNHTDVMDNIEALQERMAAAESVAADAKVSATGAASAVAVNAEEWSMFKQGVEADVTQNNTNLTLLSNQVAGLDINDRINDKLGGYAKLADVITTINDTITTLDIDSKIVAKLDGYAKSSDLDGFVDENAVELAIKNNLNNFDISKLNSSFVDENSNPMSLTGFLSNSLSSQKVMIETINSLVDRVNALTAGNNDDSAGDDTESGTGDSTGDSTGGSTSGAGTNASQAPLPNINIFQPTGSVPTPDYNPNP